ncbi:hypothetical protein AXX17_AT5G20430 [Arabidopsis thaliana]|uniref:Uncharacterized protein n=1 Tax=Arabidopsis thaliana TaxID=3702 RepID=A0A178UMA8_ARATH|nr:hypothetical protein AXX17_AT5G20430 [Arabidopsis thaliana]
MSQDMDPFTEAVTRILQEALHAMWLLAEEAKADVIREQETARKAIEEAPQVIKENSEDTEKFNSLTSEVEALKAAGSNTQPFGIMKDIIWLWSDPI